MAHVRLANTNRRGNDELEGSVGYAPTGKSMHTRTISRAHTPMMNNRVPKTGGRHTLVELINQTAGALAHMRGRLEAMADNDPAMPKLLENMDRKATFLARLRYERDHQ